eukprot:7244354-Karenia_brevis.AAC.1
MVRPGAGTLHEQLPRALEVGHKRDSLKKYFFLGQTFGKSALDEFRMPHRRAQHHHSLWAPGIRSQTIDAAWALPALFHTRVLPEFTLMPTISPMNLSRRSYTGR